MIEFGDIIVDVRCRCYSTMICRPVSPAIKQMQAGDRGQGTVTLICDHIHVVRRISGSNVLLNPLQFSNCIGCNSGACWIESYGHSIGDGRISVSKFPACSVYQSQQYFARYRETIDWIITASCPGSCITETAAFKELQIIACLNIIKPY